MIIARVSPARGPAEPSTMAQLFKDLGDLHLMEHHWVDVTAC
jgi:hypothetical protein